MTSSPIDLDSESIQYEGRWYTRDELARRIKSMLDAGDFAIGKPSNALEHLTQTIQSLRTLAFRVTPDMADAINQAAARQGRGVGAILRDAVGAYLKLPKAPEAERPVSRPPSPTGRRATEPEIPIVQVPPTPTPPDVKATPQTPVPPPPTVPGGPKAAPPQAPPTVVIDSSELMVEEVSTEEA